MPTSPFAAQLALVRTTLAALTPAGGGAPFVPAASDLTIDEEPGVLVRRFEVVGDPAPGLTQSLMQPGNRQAQRRFNLTILYDAQHDRIALEAALAADDDQLIATLESAASFATNVQLVQCTGGATVQDGDFFRRTLSFTCTYVHPF